MKHKTLEHVKSPKPDNFVVMLCFLQEYQSDFLGHSQYGMGQGIKKRWRISYWYMHDVFYEPRVVQLKGFRSVQLLDNTWCIQEVVHCAAWTVIEGTNKSSTTTRYWILISLYDTCLWFYFHCSRQAQSRALIFRIFSPLFSSFS